MNKNVKKISGYDIMTLLSIIIIFMPNGISASFSLFVNVFLIIIGIILMILYLIKFKDIFNEGIFKHILVFCVIPIVTTIINHGDYLRSFKFSYYILFCSIWSFVFFKKNYWKGIKILANLSKIFLFLNFILSIVYPNGFYVDDVGRMYSFLNIINNMEIFWIPLSCFWLMDVIKNKKSFLLNFIIIIILIFVPSYIYQCLTGILLCAFLFLFGSISYYVRTNNKLPLSLWIIGGVMGILFFAYFGIKMFPFVNKYWTLAERFILWENSLEMMYQRLILGYGIASNDEVVFYNQWRNYSPHNQFLILGLWGGIFNFVYFVFILYLLIRKQYNNKSRNLKIAFVFLIVFILYYCVEITFNMGLFFVFLFSIYLFPSIEVKQNKIQNRLEMRFQ